MAKNIAWLVRLGPLEWARHTYARPEGDPLRLLGSVRRGPQMGALGILDDGKYVMVVGDFLTPLNSSQIARALGKAKPSGPERFAQARAPARTAPAPVIIVKRRRVFAMPEGVR